MLYVGANASSAYKEILKNSKLMLADKNAPVRAGAASCLQSLAVQASIIQTTDMDATITAAIRAFEDSDYPARRAIAELLGSLLASLLSETYGICTL
jgi:hypothetical protein